MAKVTMLKKKQDYKQLGNTGRNTTKWYQRKRDTTGYEERRQTSMEVRQNCIHWRKNLYTKQLEVEGMNLMEKSW